MAEDVVPKTFRSLSEAAERKYAKVRDVPPYGHGPNNFFPKVFKAYMKLWKYQQENRAKLLESGLQRWEIGEIASRIGQLYFNQYMRTSEARFLLESYIFYEAILNRGYFEGSSKLFGRDRGLRFKELRFYARFLLVSLILNRWEVVNLLLERFKALVDDSRANFRETNFKEWKIVVQEMIRFLKLDTALIKVRPLRYCAMFDSHPASLPYVARFHAKKVLKLRDALLTSYHRNEVKFAEITLDTFRMMQCLEWEPSGSFYQKNPVESHVNGALSSQSGTSGLIDINLVADMMDPTLPPNPKKAILHRPSVTQLLSVIAMICDELPPESVMLIYLAASGTSGSSNSHVDISGTSRTFLKLNMDSHTSLDRRKTIPENHVNGWRDSSQHSESYLWLGPSRSGGSNNLYPADLIPFTRKPVFLIIDSDNSRAFKVLHGAERGEPAALLLSPLRPTFKSQSGADVIQNGSQFTLFLTSPLQAFCQMVGLTSTDEDVFEDAENIISTAFSEWEVILCSSTILDLVWAQVLSDSLLRRIILRFIFCRSVLTHFRHREDSDEYLPICLPDLLDTVSPTSKVVQSSVIRLADHFKVSHCFQFDEL